MSDNASDPGPPPIRIWWQSFVDESQNAPYLERIGLYLNQIAEPGTIVTVHGMSPPDRGFGRLTELRCGVLAVLASLDAAEQGFDAFTIGHFQDPGLYAGRSAVSIPVMGLGETSLHWAAQLGRHLALVSIDSAFARWHLEQADLYGLYGRVSHVVALDATVEDFAPAFAGDSDAYARLLERFRTLVQPLVDSGADVIVPAGALPGLLLAREHALTVGHAPVVNCVAVALKATEMAVRLQQLTGVQPSRGPSFASATQQAIADFRALVAQSPTTTSGRTAASAENPEPPRS